MSLKEEKELPAVVKEFFHQSEFVETENTVKLKAHCKKCAKVIIGQWKPTRVTSNFVSHAKVNIRLLLGYRPVVC